MFKIYVTSLICLAVISCSFSAQAQDKKQSQESLDLSRQACPAIKLSCPVNPIEPGSPISITAQVIGAASKAELTYRWSVSVGDIESGQNTPTIEVDTHSAPFQCLTVTVEVSGLPDSCPKVAACTQRALGIADPVKFDEYGLLSFKDEMPRLNNVAVQLNAEPRSQFRIVAYDGKRTPKGTAMRRVARAKEYLIKNYNIEAERILTEPLLKYSPEKYVTELWIEPRWELIAGPCN
jgi:hypothetical protein